MVHTDCLCHQAWAFVNFLDDISRDWCPDLVRPSRFTFKKARRRKNVCMYSHNKLMIWCDPTPRGKVFSLELWYLTCIPLFYETDFWNTNPCSIAPWAAYLRFRIVLRQQLVVIQWTLESHILWKWTPKSAFPIFHMPYSYPLGHGTGCLPRQDAFHGETSANTFTWAFSHWFVGTFRNEIHFQIDQTIWSSKNLAHFQTFHASKLVCLVCWNVGIHRRNPRMGLLQLLVVMIGSSQIDPQNGEDRRSTWKHTLQLERNSYFFDVWNYPHSELLEKCEETMMILSCSVLSKTSRIPCHWTPDYFRYFSWFLQISHITSLFLDWTPIFAASLMTPKPPNLSKSYHHFIRESWPGVEILMKNGWLGWALSLSSQCPGSN